MESASLLKRIQKSKPLQILFIAVVGALFTLLVQVGGLLDGIELNTLDWRFLQASHPEEADTNVVLIAIDQNSLEAFADRNVQWPWPREIYGLVVDYLREAGASEFHSISCMTTPTSIVVKLMAWFLIPCLQRP
jgi:adenylate cyclase